MEFTPNPLLIEPGGLMSAVTPPTPVGCKAKPWLQTHFKLENRIWWWRC